MPFISHDPRDRNEAMTAIATLTADCRGILGRFQAATDWETRAALMRLFDEANASRLRIARDWGLVGFATRQNTNDESLVELVLASEG